MPPLLYLLTVSYLTIKRGCEEMIYIFSQPLFLFGYIGISLQQESPGKVFSISGVVYVFSFGHFNGPGAVFSAFHVKGISGEIHTVEGHVDAHGLGETAGAGGKELFLSLVSSFFHEVQAFQGFQGTDKNGAGLAFMAADEIEAGIHAVNEVYVGMTPFAEDDSCPGCEAFEYMGPVVFVSLIDFPVGFTFYNTTGSDAFWRASNNDGAYQFLGCSDSVTKEVFSFPFHFTSTCMPMSRLLGGSVITRSPSASPSMTRT